MQENPVNGGEEKKGTAFLVALRMGFRYINRVVWAVDVFLVSLPSLAIPVTRLMVRFTWGLLLLAWLTGCSGMTSRPWFGADNEGYWLPLRVNMKLDPSVTGASLEYQDACQQSATLLFGDRLKSALSREIGMVFEHVETNATAAKNAPSEVFDGEVQISLELKQVQLFVPRRETNSYPTAVTLGGTLTYVDANRDVLYTKKLKTEAKGTVNTDREQCEVRGLAGVATEAAITLAQGFKKHLGTSTQVKRAARLRKEGGRQLVAGAGVTTAGASGPAQAPAQSQTQAQALPQAQPPSANPAGPPSISFRAMLKDESQDHVLEGGEQVTVKVEVKNNGTEVVKGVVVALSGSPSLTQMLTGRIPVGDLQPGESRRVEASGRVPPVSAVQQAELVVSVQAPSSAAGQPIPKKFIAALRPAKSQNIEVLSVDVDQIPAPVRGFERRTAVGIAIGVGSFRDTDVPGVKFAARDAEVMAEYLRTAGGIPARRVKLITDEHALKDDLAEVFEDWLPQQVEPGSLVVVFFSGRGVVDPATGAVSLLPHEGSPGTQSRAFSLRRLQAGLARLPVQQAVLLLDVTLMTPSAAVQSGTKDPVLAPPVQVRGKVLQLFGVSKVQEAHRYEHGKHGLFTYYLLKGLSGAADRDHNGFVALGELFDYARAQVSRTAKAEYENEQEPACIPALIPASKEWNLPLTRVK